jgi:WD40 repeat protein
VIELMKLIEMIVGFASPTVQTKLERNELVIKLLKQLNLDPDHPPADFTAVYQYTLVEYGIGKPKPVLEIFRHAEIQTIFRSALDQNNAALLLQAGEQFLATHPLGAEIQTLGIDARREFYQFAAIFIEVAKRTRTPAEVLTNQRLESLHRQIGTLQERLTRLPTIEGIRTEMARLTSQTANSDAQNSELASADSPAAKIQNSKFSAFALAQQMRGWFETLGYRFEPHEEWQADFFEWVINIPVRRGRYDRVLIRGIDGEAGLRDIQALRRSVAAQRTDEGWLVTARRISRAARTEVENAENHDLGCYTFDELLDQDADFSGYLDWLEAEIQQRGIEQKYVPLACTKEEVDPDTHQRLGVSRYGESDGWIDGYIDLWLADPAKEHISVLGEFGTGKTWFALHYASQALKQYRNAQQRGIDRPRLPIVIPLRDYAKAVSVESLFSEFFFRKHEIPIPGYSAFEQLNRMGKLLLIFDGFDEMAARVDRQEMINNFWELAKVVVPGAKVILTCRTEHFPEAREGRALLNAELQASTKDLTGETPQFEVLELEKFDDGQIKQVLSLQASESTVEQVLSNPQLLDLARRPVMTELILEALPDIEAGKPVDMSRVYLYAVRRKMERDIKAERTFTSMADKLYFLCELSWEMLSSDRMSLNYREFPDRLRKLFGAAVEKDKDLDHWHYDMMGQTLLIRNADGDYTPAHRSLLEFFVAYKFAAELGALAPDFLELAQMKSNVDTTLPAREYTWSEYFGDRTQVAPLLGFVSESLERLRSGFGKDSLTKTVLELLVPILVSCELSLQHSIGKILVQIKGKSSEVVNYIGGNLATTLVQIDRAALENQDLSDMVLLNADLSLASLRDSNFTATDLKNSIFASTLGVVFSTALSANGQYLVTGEGGGNINLWGVEQCQLLMTFKGHTQSVWAVALSTDGMMLASASDDRTVRLWNLITGDCVRILQGYAGRVRALTFSPTDQTLVTSGGDHTIKVWDFQTGLYKRTITGHKDFVLAVSFSPDGQVLASGSADKTIKLWDTQTGECLKTIGEHHDWVESLSFSSNGQILASGSADKTIKLWDSTSGKCIRTLTGHNNTVLSVTFSREDVLVSGSGDRSIKIWNIQNGECLQTLLAHTDSVRSVNINTDGKILVSGSRDRTVRLWNLGTGECLKVIQGRGGAIRSLAFNPRNKALAVASANQLISILNLQTNEHVEIVSGRASATSSIAFSPDGQILASGGNDGIIRYWYVNGEEICRNLYGHTEWVRSVAFSFDGQLLASASGDKTIKLWNMQTGECIQTMRGHDSAIESVAFSHHSQFLASGGYDPTVKLWDMTTGKCSRDLWGHTNIVRSVAFSPDGGILVSGSIDETVRFWNFRTGECFRVLQGNTNGVVAIAFSPDGRTLASSGYDQKIRLWDVSSGTLLIVLSGHSNFTESVAFSADGQILASGSNDGILKIWDVNTSQCLKTMRNDRPYEGMNITGVKGLDAAAIATLKALGAVEDE